MAGYTVINYSSVVSCSTVYRDKRQQVTIIKLERDGFECEYIVPDALFPDLVHLMKEYTNQILTEISKEKT